ncbi:MAG: monomeric [FeFe] hydrogenase [Endomicrobium sp.]|jgi:[FeFe] hydrogenase (group B1/B3)|nr:monomeric [FeFe] hydrogenase [Endomicrobium sp.]
MNNKSQEIGFKKEVLEKIIKAFFSSNFEESVRRIPLNMCLKGCEVFYRCCIYKERAVLRGRVIAGLGFSIEDDDEATDLSEYAKKALEREHVDDKPLTFIETACQGCASSRIYVTDICQGCEARSCKVACKFNAVSIVNGRSKIDPAKCKNCKMCISLCPYGAIVKIAVPCEDACPVSAIKKNENGTAKIDYNVCISCGKCMMACPFGVVNEKSQIVDVLKNIKTGKKVVAMVAPSIVGQFQGSIYQLKAALKKVGFYDVYEVAEGSDITTKNEALEFVERMESGESFMTTSCCASYSQFIKKHLFEVKEFVSTTKTPMYYIAQKVKTEHPEYITVFISPCVAKKNEAYDYKNVNYVISYEELDALFSTKDIKVQDCIEEKFEIESSKQGRNFGVTGGVAGAVAKLLEDKKNFVRAYVINGLNKETIKHLKKMVKDKKCLEGNLVEVMGCEGGCIGGNATICASRIAQKAIKILCDQSKDIEKK